MCWIRGERIMAMHVFEWKGVLRARTGDFNAFARFRKWALVCRKNPHLRISTCGS